MTGLSYQAAFDTAIEGILKQGGSSSIITSSGVFQCKYRNEDGRKCAIGHLIPDNKYQPEIEGKSPISDVMDYLFDQMTNDDRIFLKNLQNVHDQIYVASDTKFIEVFKQKAQKFAEQYKLEYRF